MSPTPLPSPRTRAYRHPLPAAETVRRVVAAVRQRQAEGRAWAISDFAITPEIVEAVKAHLEERERVE